MLSIQIGDQTYKIDAGNALDIAIRLDFGGAQPNAYGVAQASSNACEAGELVGDTRRGGSCNFEQIKFIPHCNGTHTESIGHLTHERISVHDCLRDSFILARLISVTPEKASETNETYAVELSDDDLLITKARIESALKDLKLEIPNFESNKPDEIFPSALIVRTLPNDQSKLSKTYLETVPPFFSTEAMQFLNELKIKHLLADTPSIDRIFDEGKLSNHRIFWNVEAGEFAVNANSLIENTITELIYVANKIPDGEYLLNLQIAPFATDASPSRPRLFAVEKCVNLDEL